MTRAVEWVVGGNLVTVLLDGPEVVWYRSVATRVAGLPAGAERSAAVAELRVVMDAKAILGARFAPVEQAAAA